MISGKFLSLLLSLSLPLQLGFDFSRHNIPLEEIHEGGPPKDGIPAIFNPQFVSAGEANYLEPKDRVVGLEINGEAKAYPIKILNWHEIVNDLVGGKAVFITYCPLCGTGMTFDAVVDGKRFLFGVSGKLYNNNVLFYDKETESLWSQIKMEAVTGPMTGKHLKLLAAEHTTWQAWKAKYPGTKVLSLKTGYPRNYTKDPYTGYETSNRIYFPVSHEDSRLSRKAWILGILLNGEAKAYPFDELERKSGPIQNVVGGKTVLISYDKGHRSAVVTDLEGEVLPSIQAYWFAWVAFYPETALYSGSKKGVSK